MQCNGADGRFPICSTAVIFKEEIILKCTLKNI